MITAFDDYSIHQTTDPIAHPVSGDRNYYDRYWFNGLEANGAFAFECGFGLYPNRFVMDGHFSVVHNGRQYSFHASRRCPLDRTQTVIGPLQVKIEEPMRRVRLRLDPNENGIACDLLFSACTAPSEEPKNRLSNGLRVVMHNSRFTQFGRWSGWYEVEGRRTEVSAASVYGTRDKSWGVRPVGEPEGGGSGNPDAELGVYWCWSPVNFGDFCTQFGSFEDHDGRPTQLSGCIVPTYPDTDSVPTENESSVEEMATVRHDIEWEPGTRYPKSVVMAFVPQDGPERRITLRSLLRFYMRGIGYGHPEWAHGVWQGEEKFGYEHWSADELDPLDHPNIHVHHLVAADMDGQAGIGTLETVILGRHSRSGFKDFLDGAGA